MKNILITGGAGFIGSNLSLKLIDKGYNVTVLDNLSPQIHGENTDDSTLYSAIKGKVNFIKGDVTSKADWLKAIQDQEIVVHLAAETGTGQSMYEITRYIDVNVKGSAIFLDLLTNTSHSIKKIIVASSRAIYGEGKYSCTTHGDVYPDSRKTEDMEKGDFEVHCPICFKICSMINTDEESKLSPSSIYGITKLTQEQMFLTIGRSLGISALAFRYQNVYGPGQSLSNPYTGILSIFSTRLANDNSINIFEDGKESRDFVYIDDVVNATIAGIEHEQKIVEAFNVGSGAATDIITLTDLLMDNMNKKVKVEVSGRFRVGDIRHNVADITKIKRILKFEPNVFICEGIKTFVRWVKNEKIKEDKYDESIIELKSKGLYK